MTTRAPSRRDALQLLAAAGAFAASPSMAADGMLQRPIPSTGETIPAIGLGTWITFNVGRDQAAQDACADVMATFFAGGGRMIDSSPMYGSSQATIGHGLARIGGAARVFSAEKVWITGGGRGPGQIEQSRALWGVPRFDLMQVHNLLSWEAHLATLFAMKADGRLRYVGITTSEGRRHGEIERIMREHPIDFVQVSYNVLDREIEQRILPLAQERRIAVIVNRPFREGALLRAIGAAPLPGFAAELGAASWAEYILKFILGHPAVTCAIPATTRVDHVRQNLAAARGPLPDEAMRRRMAAHVQAL